MDILLKDIAFNENGLIPVIAQQYDTGEIVMMAWMNTCALTETLTTKQMCYFSRSRNTLWRKGESSNQTQTLKELLLDCDGDTLIAKIDQKGVACHTGRRSCFYRSATPTGWEENQAPRISPKELYNPT